MTEWKSGQVILGEYTIEKELGRGGMGQVWLVKSQSTGRRFAVKQALIRDEKYRKAFLAELQTWIDLPEHPNIVPCRFFRTVGDDVLIFSDFVDGGSLKNWIDSRRLYAGDRQQSLERILDTAIQFAWGLHSIHELGLVHQDVKPGNVLMSSGSEAALQGMRVQVSDYGLARARARSGAQGGQAVGEGSILLSSGGYTPAYCSPEQAKGLPISRKTDLWSWGVSVLEMFTGGVTWHSGHLAGAVLDQYVEDADESSGIPVMPSTLADILRKCFQNDPAQRWANLGEVVAHLKTAYSRIAGEDYDRELVPIVHRGTPQAGLDQRRTTDGGVWANPRLWLEKGLRLSGRNPAEAKEIVDRHAHSRRGQLVADLAVFEEAKSVFLDMVKKGRRDLEPDVAVLCFEKALCHDTCNDTAGAIEEYDHAISVWRMLVEQGGRGDLFNSLARGLMWKAITLTRIGDVHTAAGLFDECLTIRRHQLEREGQREIANDLAAALANKGIAVSLLGDLQEALHLYDASISITRTLVEQEGRIELLGDLGRVMLSKATALETMGDMSGAAQVLDECISIQRQIADGGSSLAVALMNKAILVSRLDDQKGAGVLLDECIVIWMRLVEEDGRTELSGYLAQALRNKANVLALADGLEGAVVEYDRSIAILWHLVEQEGRTELAGDLAGTLMGKAVVVRSMGDLQGAEELCDWCNCLAAGVTKKALEFLDSGELRESLGLFDRSIGIRQQLLDSEWRPETANDLAIAMMLKAAAVLETGDLRGAMGLYDGCISIWQRVLASEYQPHIANFLGNAFFKKANVTRNLQDLRGAVTLCETCMSIWRPLASQEGPQMARPVDIAMAEALRIACLWELQGCTLLQGDCARAQEAYSVILRESQRTGRADLAKAVEWAQDNLASILPRTEEEG